MPIKRFHPSIDGFALSHDWRLEQSEIQQTQAILDSALSETLTYLRQTYKGAVEAYEIEEWFKNWLEIGLPEHSFLNTGLLYAVLDHYYARYFLPKRLKKSNSKRALKFRAYLVRRILDSLRANAAEQLKTVAISKFMPDSWVREDKIKHAIRDELESIGVYGKPEVEFDLQIPRSGKHWFRDKTIEEWEKLKTHLDECKPLPITCITKAGSYSHIYKTVIAYDYNLVKQDVVEILVYELDNQTMDGRVRFNLKPSMGRRPLHGEIEGFYLENYEPIPVPVSLWLRIVHFILPWTLIWYIKRLIFFMIRIPKKEKINNKLEAYERDG